MARTFAQCGSMRRNERDYAFVVGGYGYGAATASCEYQDWLEPKWKSCASLPYPISHGQLINEPETGDLLLLGGRNGTDVLNTIYRLSNIDDEKWILQDQTMQVARSEFSALYVPNDFFPCSKKSIQHDEL